MFRKLRLRLTLINAAVFGIIFLLIMAGIFGLMSRSLFLQSDQLLRMIAMEAGSPAATGNLIEHERHRPRFFYVKTTPTGEVTATSDTTPLTAAQLTSILSRLREHYRPQGPDGGPAGTLRWQGEPYRYFAAPLQGKDQGYVWVFLNVESEHETIGHLMGALTAAGLGGLALAFFGSLLLADRALIPIRKSWQRQKDFAADASHELRTPLAVIQTNLELVLDNPGELVASQAKWLGNIQTEARRMARLVDDLLFLARADSGQKELHFEYFNLQQALRETVEPFEPVAAEQGVTLTLFSSDGPRDPEILHRFFGDEAHLRQLVVILLDNALRHTPAGGQVSIDLTTASSAAEITVADTGKGIPHEHLNKIFDRFYRVDQSRTSEGTGLGLAIAQWIVQEHRGMIRVASIPGSGTTFTVRLP